MVSLQKNLVYVSYKYINMKLNQMCDHVLSICSIGWSIENIDNILGIILLTLSIARILWNTGYKIYIAIKKKKFEDVEKSFNDGIKEIKKLDNKEEKND